MATAAELFATSRAVFGSIPHQRESYVCPTCLGPVTNYQQCYGCNRLFNSGVPARLWDVIVPMTSVLNPSPWYVKLSTYKRGFTEHGKTLVSLAYTYLTANATQVAAVLGGDPDVFTIVPSKRGVDFATQPLRRTLARIEWIKARLAQTLVYHEGTGAQRWAYTPNAFTAGPYDVRGKRIVLIEDSWVTGATAVSAAGALLDFGAESVLVMPMARVVDAGYWPDDHPYRIAMARPYDVSAWPR